jgi:alanine-glyoxylate transaminase/serine-glyoxylate transaminase/serine-pyruvate transaminase
MISLNSHPSGRHFLQIPGPSPVPDRILRAIDNATIDHRGPEFATLGKAVISGMKQIFRTDANVVIYPSSGTGAWEAALVNTMSPGDLVLMVETGQFATLWKKMADKLGVRVEFIAGDWRHGVDPVEIEARLAQDKGHEIRAVCVVHNETSTGTTSRIHEVRKAIDRAGHPALFMVDTVSGLACADYRHDEWGVDVSVSGSQKGLMMPPGLSFNAVSATAATFLLGLGRDGGDQSERLFPVHAVDQHAVRPGRSDSHVAGGRTRECVCQAPAARRSDPPCGPRLGAGNLVPGTGRIQPGANRGRDA